MVSFLHLNVSCKFLTVQITLKYSAFFLVHTMAFVYPRSAASPRLLYPSNQLSTPYRTPKSIIDRLPYTPAGYLRSSRRLRRAEEAPVAAGIRLHWYG